MLIMGLLIFAVICLVAVIINQIIIMVNEHKFNKEINEEIDFKFQELEQQVRQMDVDLYRRITKGIEVNKDESS